MPTRPPVHTPAGVQTAADRRVLRDATRSPSRTYGRRWQKLRAAFLARNPLCQCDANGGQGCGYAATVVDHRVPHRGDDRLMYDWGNLRSMTKACHDAKTASRDGGFGNPIR